MEINFESFFIRASRLDKVSLRYYYSKELNSLKILDGAKRFKRNALGLCGKNSIKSLDEMAKLFYKTGMVSSLDEGKKILPYLINEKVIYDSDSSGNKKVIFFEEYITDEEKKEYMIKTEKQIYGK